MPEARIALGIDVGGTKVALVLVDADGGVVAQRRLVNRQHPNAKALLGAVASEAAGLAEGHSLHGVGVGICELVGVSGEIESSTTIPWTRADLEQALSGIGPLTLDADVR